MTLTATPPTSRRRRPMRKTYRGFEKTPRRSAVPADRGDGTFWAALRVEAARKVLSTFQAIADRDHDAGRLPSPLLMDRIVTLMARLADAEADLDRIRSEAKLRPDRMDADDEEDKGAIVDG